MSSTARDSRRRYRLRVLLQIAAISLAGGALIGVLDSGDWLRGSLQGAAVGLAIALGSGAWGLYVADTEALRQLRRRSFVASLLLRSLHYLVVVIGALAGAQWLFGYLFDGTPGDPLEAMAPVILAVSGGLILLFNLFFELDRLLGRQVVLSLLTGRHARPRLEQRALLIVDLAGSTGLAERLGAERFHALLSDFFFDLSDPVLEARGEIHRYVGDGMIVTWPLDEAVSDGRCLFCIQAMRDRIASRAERYRGKYGSVPAFRAALHCGEVVVGEMGDYRREIVMLGDVVNTTARIEQECRALAAFALVSDDLLSRLPASLAAGLQDAGTHRLRGRREALKLWRIAEVPTS